jgi:hypothetical protein
VVVSQSPQQEDLDLNASARCPYTMHDCYPDWTDDASAVDSLNMGTDQHPPGEAGSPAADGEGWEVPTTRELESE